MGQASVQVAGEEKAVIELYTSMDISLGRAERFSARAQEEGPDYVWGLGVALSLALALLVYLLLVRGIRRKTR